MFRKKRNRNIFYIIFLIVFVFGINRFFYSFSDMIKHSYSAILYPVFLSQEYIIDPVKKIFETKRSRQELEKLVLRLNRDNDNLIAENIKLRSTLSYYDQIKEVLEFKNRYEIQDMKFCKVLFKHVNNTSHFIYIDKGFANGVFNDMVAIYDNFLLGKVVETYEFYSKVLLVTDKQCKVSAYCEKSGVNGISEGLNEFDKILLNRVSHLESVNTDDIVLSSGYGLVFPQGFALGKVVDVQKGELYNTVTVKPLFDVRTIEYCYLLRKGELNGSKEIQENIQEDLSKPDDSCVPVKTFSDKVVSKAKTVTLNAELIEPEIVKTAPVKTLKVEIESRAMPLSVGNLSVKTVPVKTVPVKTVQDKNISKEVKTEENSIEKIDSKNNQEEVACESV